ncbi:hypothetical protein Syun_009184 [Stephania yunnanensis]|uniref:Protein kinase domain-containing protein n=1 Tax=Stephania yunnanensis TaxID=152371 RepID=A0AAP0KF39_9MAGN
MGNSQVIAFCITVSCVAFVASKIIISVLLYKRWQRKHQVFQDGMAGGKMVMFRSPTMQYLTSDVFLKKTMRLTNKDIIGSGGYGTVYRLAIDDSTSFAVKRLNKGSAERDRGFERELEAMGDIKHRNIVTLHGYYTAPHYNLLIYDLMPNGSLDKLLYGRSNEKKPLDWPSRYKIAIGAARGIAYLHHDCIPQIIHRDIKPSNILLDKNMDARVSDFGLATLMQPDQTHVSTFVAGTFGYLAPGIVRKPLVHFFFLYFFLENDLIVPIAEYFDTGRATAKGDVYSFGVVLLELLTGKRPMDEAFIEEGTKLVTWVKVIVDTESEEFAIDSRVGCCPLDEVKCVFSIAFMCLQPEPSNRPTMAEVVKMLEQIKSAKLELVS